MTMSVLESRVRCLYLDNAVLKAFALVPLLGEIKCLSTMRTRNETLHPPDSRLAQLDKHSALPRVSVWQRIGFKLQPRVSYD